jgi:hypothetical protein
LASPTWFALIVQVPAAPKVTVEPLTVHTEVVALANVTGDVDAPPVAATVYVAPPTTAFAGAVEVKVIVCDPLPTENVCGFVGAEL